MDGACGEGVDNSLFSLIASFAIAIKDRVGEGGVEFGEGVGNEDRIFPGSPFMPLINVLGVLRDSDRPGSTANAHGPLVDRTERVLGANDRHSAFGMIGNIE